MSRIAATDDDTIRRNQEKDARHGDTSQPEDQVDAERPTDLEHIESDARANDSIGGLFRKRPKSDTEQALERAVYGSDEADKSLPRRR